MSGNKTSFGKTVLRIALPVALQSMLQSSFSMIDQVMVGQLGSTSIAAVEIAGKPSSIYNIVIGAVAAIAGIMVSQYYGKKDKEAVHKSVSANLTVTILLALVFTAACLLWPWKIAGIYTEDALVIEDAVPYLQMIAWTYLPMGIASILAVRIRCMDKAIYPLYAGIASALVNTGLNWLLIFGNAGMPKLGVRGAAIASVLSQVVNLMVIVVFYLLLCRGQEGLRTQLMSKEGDASNIFKRILWSLQLGKEGYRQYFAMLLPVVVNEFLWSVGQNVNTYIYGHIGTRGLAAMSLTGPIQGLLIGALSGISQAAGIIIGKRLGQKEYEAAYKESKLLCLYGLVSSLLLSVALIGFRNLYTEIYQVEDVVKETAAQLLLAFAVLAPIKVENMILGGGVIRSGGRTRYIMMIDMFGTWVVGVPLGLLTGLVLKLPIVWVYFILSQEELVRLLITIVMFRSRKWMETIE